MFAFSKTPNRILLKIIKHYQQIVIK
jgi:hypothetical protein